MKKMILSIGLITAFAGVNAVWANEVTPLSAATSAYLLTRENNYDAVFAGEILPFFNGGQDGYFTGEGNLQLHYKKFIHPKAKANILIIHGYTESMVRYRELIYDFYRNGYSVYMYEHRGHGYSDRLLQDPEVVYVDDFMNYVRDMNRFIDREINDKNHKLFLFAHSMGGGIATVFLEKYPHKVDGAVLSAPMLDINTGAVWYPVAKWIAKIATALGFGSSYAPLQRGYDPDSWVLSHADTSSAQRFSRTKSDTVRDSRLHMGDASNKWLNEVFENSEAAVTRENAQQAVAPIMLLQPEKDTYVKPAGQNQFCSYALHCQVVEISGSRHHSSMEVDAIRIPVLNRVLQFYDQLLGTHRLSGL